MKKSDEHICISILGDPHASETRWFDAAMRLQAITSQRSKWWKWLADSFPLLITAVFAMVAAYSCCAYIDLAFDWGYQVVKAVFGQPSPQAANQGFFAIYALAHIFFPANVGFAFAIGRRYFGKQHHWWAGVIAVMLLENAIWFLLLDSRFEPDSLLWLTTNFVSAVLSFVFGKKIVDKFYAYWHVRFGGFVDLRRVLPLCGLYLIPSLIVSIASMLNLGFNLPLYAEIGLYCLPLFLIGFFIYKPSASLRAALTGSSLVVSPILLSGLINVSLTSSLLLLDFAKAGLDLGWRAILSGLLITLLTVGATIIGCLFGKFFDHFDRHFTATQK